MFLSPLVPRHTTASRQAALTMGSNGQVRVVIAMMAGRKKIEQDVLAVLLGEEGKEGGGGGAAKGGMMRETGNECGFRGFEVFWMNEIFSLPPLFPQDCLSW